MKMNAALSWQFPTYHHENEIPFPAPLHHHDVDTFGNPFTFASTLLNTPPNQTRRIEFRSPHKQWTESETGQSGTTTPNSSEYTITVINERSPQPISLFRPPSETVMLSAGPPVGIPSSGPSNYVLPPSPTCLISPISQLRSFTPIAVPLEDRAQFQSWEAMSMPHFTPRTGTSGAPVSMTKMNTSLNGQAMYHSNITASGFGYYPEPMNIHSQWRSQHAFTDTANPCITTPVTYCRSVKQENVLNRGGNSASAHFSDNQPKFDAANVGYQSAATSQEVIREIQTKHDTGNIVTYEMATVDQEVSHRASSNRPTSINSVNTVLSEKENESRVSGSIMQAETEQPVRASVIQNSGFESQYASPPKRIFAMLSEMMPRTIAARIGSECSPAELKVQLGVEVARTSNNSVPTGEPRKLTRSSTGEVIRYSENEPTRTPPKQQLKRTPKSNERKRISPKSNEKKRVSETVVHFDSNEIKEGQRCEYCKTPIVEPVYGTGRFCGSTCARTYSIYHRHRKWDELKASQTESSKRKREPFISTEQVKSNLFLNQNGGKHTPGSQVMQDAKSATRADLEPQRKSAKKGPTSVSSKANTEAISSQDAIPATPILHVHSPETAHLNLANEMAQQITLPSPSEFKGRESLRKQHHSRLSLTDLKPAEMGRRLPINRQAHTTKEDEQCLRCAQLRAERNDAYWFCSAHCSAIEEQLTPSPSQEMGQTILSSSSKRNMNANGISYIPSSRRAVSAMSSYEVHDWSVPRMQKSG